MTEDRGAPIGYLVLAEGTPVQTSDGAEAGWVKRVLADEGADIFHSIVVRTRDGNRAVPAARIDALYENLVVLAIDRDDLAALPHEDRVGD